MIALGWQEMGDLSKLPAQREAFKTRLMEIKPNQKKGQYSNAVGQMFRFIHEAKKDDLIVYPFKLDRQVHIGKIIGAYQYGTKLNPNYPHQRSVEWLKSFPRTRLSQGALYEMGSAITFFQIKNYANEFGAREIATLEVAELDQWLRKEKGSARSRNNLRDTTMTLFRWAQMQGYLPSGKTTIECTTEAKEKSEEIVILTPEQMESLLRLAWGRKVEQAVLYLAIGGFAGLRSAEIERLEWKDIAEDHIEISASKAKTASRRIVPLAQNLREWLTPLRKKEGRVIPTSVNKHVRPLVRELWGAWSQNCLRHSWVSYRLAETQNTAQVALEAGNSPAKIFSNYRSIRTPDGQVVRAELAKKWFSVLP